MFLKVKKSIFNFFLSAKMQNSFWYHCWDGVMWHEWRIWFRNGCSGTSCWSVELNRLLELLLAILVSVGPHNEYFCRRKFEPQVEKVSTALNVASVKFKNY